MNKLILPLSALFGFLSVGMGAFAAHALQEKLPEKSLDTLKTASYYLLVHTLVTLWSMTLIQDQKSSLFFFLGNLLFPFSLYLLVFTSWKPFAYFTPIGGVFYLVGWFLLFLRLKNHATN